MNEVKIIRLDPNQWEEYKNLRLKALKEDPEAFGMLHEEAIKLSDDEWRKHLELAWEELDHWRYFAKLNSRLVGMVGANVIISEDLRDTVKVQNVYVAKEVRGKGVGKKLLNHLFGEISKNPKIKKAKIKVFTSQKPAIALYESVGAKIVDKIEESWPDGRTNETFVMEKTLP